MDASEVTIDSDLVRRLIALQFPEWGGLPVEPVARGGRDNKTFHLGEHMLVRLPRAARYSAQVAKEQRWLPKLGPLLPVSIPAPLAMGAPGEGYPWHWSVYRWIGGEPLTAVQLQNELEFATALAGFLDALQRIDAAEGPAPGAHNFFRGGLLATYDVQTREAIGMLKAGFDAWEVTSVWEAALGSVWKNAPVWLHGDFAAGNLLASKGQLSGVIDFGCVGVGDPACDLAIAWTYLGREGRHAFREGLSLDGATWARGRGWALWKALIQITGLGGGRPVDIERAGAVLCEVLADHRLCS